MKLSEVYFESKILAFTSAIVFCFSNFTFGHFDDLNIIFYGLIFLSIYNFKMLILTQKRKYLVFLTLCSLAQIHTSFYNYCVLILILLILGTLNIKLFKKKFIPHALIFISFHLIASYQFISPRLELKKTNEFTNPWNNKAIANIHSFFSIKDFIRKIPGNIYFQKGDINTAKEEHQIFGALIKSGYRDHLNPLKEYGKKVIVPKDNTVYYHQIRKAGFIGYITLLIILLGFLKIKNLNYRNEVLIFLVFGILFSLGSTFQIGERIYKTPLFYFYENFEFVSYFRVPTRIYFLTLFSISLIYSHALLELKKQTKIKNLIIFCLSFSTIFLFENIPFPFRKSTLPSFDPKSFSALPKGRVLHLPSQIGQMFFDDSNDFFPYSREFIYMNWASSHKHSIANGVNSYFTKKRFDLQEAIDKLDIKALRDIYDIKFISIHKHMSLGEEDEKQISNFSSLKNLELIQQDNNTLIYKIN